MRLTLKKTKRFTLPNDPDNSYIEIEHLKQNGVNEIKESTTSTKLIDGSLEIEVDGYSQKTKLAKACLTDWGGLFDESDRPLKFTPQNVAKSAEFMIVVGDEKKSFYEWIDDCRVELAEEVEEESKVAEGN